MTTGPIRRTLDEANSGGRCCTCGREKATATSCTTETILFPDGTMHDAISYGEESYDIAGDRCPDCGVTEGGYHHPFCALEQCPRCPGRLLRCPCLDSDHTR